MENVSSCGDFEVLSPSIPLQKHHYGSTCSIFSRDGYGKRKRGLGMHVGGKEMGRNIKQWLEGIKSSVAIPNANV